MVESNRSDCGDAAILRLRLQIVENELREAKETIEAIRAGDVDAIVVQGSATPQIYTLENDDQPYRRLIEQIGEGALTLTQDGVVLYCNSRMANMLCMPIEKVIGCRIQTMVTADELDSLECLLAQREGRGEFTLQAAEDRTLPVHLSLTNLCDDAMLRLCGVLTDVTEQRQAEATLRQAHANLVAEVAARARAESLFHQAQKVQALGQLAGGIAHDFNNILQGIAGAAELIEKRPGDLDRTRRLARAARDAAARGSSITGRLLSFARRGELHADAIGTTEVLQAVGEMLAHTLGSHIVVRVEVPLDVPALLVDRGQLETALVNLGTNARDAMEDGGTLILSAAAEHVAEGAAHLHGLAPGAYVRIGVADTGVGMDANTLSRVAEPFFTTKPVGQGTGLGMAMVKGFAEQSGGGMSVASTPGIGTTVTLWLRQASSEASRTSGDEASASEPGALSARILLVDDDDLVRETLAAQLEDLGFGTVIAASGAEALAFLEAGEVVDAMVSDLSMPGMNGVATLQKARVLRPGLPCFLLTGHAGERAALASENVFTVIRKPVSVQAFATRIMAALPPIARQNPAHGETI